VLLPNGHRLASKNTVSVKDIEGERFILISLPHSRDYFLSIFRPSRDYSYDGKRIVCKALSGTFPPQKIALASTMERKLSSADEAFLRIARAHFSH
jgi:hypothetical protein